MSGFSRLIRLVPCLWAAARISNYGAGQISVPVQLGGQSLDAWRHGQIDLLHALSFTARTVVLAGPRPARGTSPRRSFLRAPSRPNVNFDGFVWVRPTPAPVRAVKDYWRSISKRFRRGPRLPIELQVKILHLAVKKHPNMPKRALTNLRLVSRSWNQELVASFWRHRWFHLAPKKATLPALRQRIAALINLSPVVLHVKIDARHTEIVLRSESQLRELLPEIVNVQATIRSLEIGRNDPLNEALLKWILRATSPGIREFGFRVQDAMLFAGPTSIFSLQNVTPTGLSRVVIDITGMTIFMPGVVPFQHLLFALVQLIKRFISLRHLQPFDVVIRVSKTSTVTVDHVDIVSMILHQVDAFRKKVGGKRLIFDGPNACVNNYARRQLAMFDKLPNFEFSRALKN
ncbi:hypothetical protein BCV70DRAFT_204047 [Testicularia cyperi]|uniref:F-box domain-containing protein n=1 Tax=Testicularia cyperi TaxID=1882483 RepID=A0A317Y0T7_9BASI|nr:hypothetical protein BCV70DRAFT_204047 [Testicularia cyperi]